MNKKVNIQKLKEDLLLKNGSNKSIYPQTIDKAVYTKWLNQYMSLDNVLQKKISNVLSYVTFSNTDYEAAETEDTEDTEVRRFYHLFTFSDSNKKYTFNNLIKVTHGDFKKIIRNSGDSSDVDTIDSYHNYPLRSEECLNERLKYNTVRNLYIENIDLHSNSNLEFVLRDEDGNYYSNGDTIYFNSYPGKLYLSLKGIDMDEHLLEVKNAILSIGTYNLYFLSDSGVQPSNGYISMNTRWADSDKDSDEYKNPNKLIKNPGESINIATLNAIFDLLFNGETLIYILPSDYPTEVNSDTIQAYNSQVKKGIINLSEILERNGEPQIMTTGISPCTFTAVFNPREDFVFINDSDEVNLTQNNEYKNEVLIQGKNTALNSTVDIEILPRGVNILKFGIKGQDEDGYSDYVRINNSDIENGVELTVLPSQFKTNLNGKLPFNGEAGTTSLTLACRYNDSDNNVSKYQEIPLRLIISEQEATFFNSMIVTPIINVPKPEQSLAFVSFVLTNSIEDITINKVYIKFNKIVGDTFSTDTQLIDGFDYKYWLGDATEEVIVDFDNTNVDSWPIERSPKVFTKEELKNGKLTLAVSIPHNYVGKAVIVGKVMVEGQTESKKSIKVTIPFDFSNTEEHPAIDEDVYEQLNVWHQSNGDYPVMSSKDIGYGKVINTLTPDKIVSVINEDRVKNIKSINNNFSQITELTDGDFMQYLTSLTVIPNECFYGNINMTSVVIPDNIIEIGRLAFAGTGLTEVVVPNSVETLGSAVFAHCPNLVKVTLGTGITSIKDSLFYNSPAITDVFLLSEEFVAIRIIRQLGRVLQLFPEGSVVTLHVPQVEIDGVSLKSKYEDPGSTWQNINNVTINVVEIN